MENDALVLMFYRIVAWNRAGSKAPFVPLKFGSPKITRMVSASDCPSPSRRASSSRAASANGLLQHLAVEAEGAGLIRGQRTAELAAELLQPIVKLAKFVDRNLGVANGGKRRLSEPSEMSAMPQTPKLTINAPMAAAMMALPSRVDEAFRIP